MSQTHPAFAVPPDLLPFSPALAAILFLHGGSAVCAYDAEDRLTYWNDRYVEFFPEIRHLVRVGLPFIEIGSRFLAVQYPHADPAELATGIEGALLRHRDDPGPLQFQRADDGRWFELRMFPQPDGGRIKLWRDITSERLPGTDGSQLLSLMTVANVGVTVHDADGSLRYVNSRFFSENFLRVIGRIPALQKRLRRCDYWLEFQDMFDGDRIFGTLILDSSVGPNESPVVLRAKTGRSFRIEEQAWKGGIVSIWTDVTELIEREEALRAAHVELTALNARLRDISERDALTGLPNRRHFDAALAEAQALARTGACRMVGVLDLDYFKTINDRYGHDAGDAVLIEAAERMQEALEPGDLLARLGGEEFGILFRSSTPATAWAAADTIRKSLSVRPFSVRADEVVLTASIGLAQLVPARDAVATLQRADVALYEAKSAGRDQVRQDPFIIESAPVHDPEGASAESDASQLPAPSPELLRERGLDAETLARNYRASGAGEHPTFGRADWELARTAMETIDDYWGWVSYRIALALGD